MIWLFLLAQLGFFNTNGGTPHTVELIWPGITVTQANDDGTTFVRPPLGYYVYRAEIKSSIQGPWLVLNPDALVVGMMEAGGSLDPCVYRDETVQQGFLYVYAITALDYAGESPLSNLSAAGPIYINPNSSTNLQSVVH